jgi:two-component system, chemotaxis family, protein-glutamate methylesterase/glutaminase
VTATKRIRAVVAEDSPTTRQLLVTLLGSDPDIEVVGEAVNGREAIELTWRLRPSVVVMDIRMPVMDGIEATRQIMRDVPTPVVIVTAVADSEVELSLRAVQLGALTVQPKPPAPDSPRFSAEAARLIRLIKALADVKVVRRRWEGAARVDFAPAFSGAVAGGGQPRSGWPTGPDVGGVRSPLDGTVEIVAVAASTGGPAALFRLLERLPANSVAPVLVVQHIADGFTRGLVSWLSRATAMTVKVAEQGEPLAPGTVYVAAEERHLEVGDNGTISLSAQPPVGGFRPSATVLFRSVAERHGRAAAAVVLTGMGSDGMEGVAAVKRAGGRVLAQDEATSVVFGMPGAVVTAGLADVVASVEDLAAYLSRYMRMLP